MSVSKTTKTSAALLLGSPLLPAPSPHIYDLHIVRLTKAISWLLDKPLKRLYKPLADLKRRLTTQNPQRLCDAVLSRDICIEKASGGRTKADIYTGHEAK